jgi:hypothetical protein
MAIINRSEKLEYVAQLQSVATLEGLEQHQVATLVSVAEEMNDPDDFVPAFRIRDAMERAGFNKLATTLG